MLRKILLLMMILSMNYGCTRIDSDSLDRLEEISMRFNECLFMGEDDCDKLRMQELDVELDCLKERISEEEIRAVYKEGKKKALLKFVNNIDRRG